MSFVSLAFAVLFTIVFLYYYILPQKFRWILLLAASYVFYAYFNVFLIFLIWATTAISYLAGIAIEKTENKRGKKAYMIIAVCLCLGILIFFKYFNFLSASVNSLFALTGGDAEGLFIKLVLPVGISFYTFQTLSYVIDVYRGKIKAEKHLGYYALFVAFFPQLVAGPIERPQKLLPQFKVEHKFDLTMAKQGLMLLLCGYVKKVVIADTLGVYVNSVFNATDLSGINGLSVLLAAVLFLIQVYCDFSGYSDIATGCAKMLGIELSVNFKKPFSSQSVTEFWSRWHITLSDWFRDYVYLPLAFRTIGKKHVVLRHSLHILLVMFLCGFWHGANWTFVLWGLLLGVYQIIESLCAKPSVNWYKKRKVDRNAKWRVILRQAVTFLLIALSMVFFRANTTADAFTLYSRLFTSWSFSGAYFTAFVEQTAISWVACAIIVMSVVLLRFVDDFISVPRGKITLNGEASAMWNSSYVYLLWLVILASAILLAKGQGGMFIYFQF